MIIIWGTRLAGKTDVVPNLCYVRTQYGHMWWIPIIPLRTYIILHGSEDGGGGFKGKQISMSFKSVMSGWLRTASIFAGIFGVVLMAMGGLEYADHKEIEALGGALFGLAVVAGAVLVYWMCEHFSRASRERGYQLAEELGLPPHIIDQILDGQVPTEEDVQDVQPADDDDDDGSRGMPTPRRHDDL